jgi:hypothetical protein
MEVYGYGKVDGIYVKETGSHIEVKMPDKMGGTVVKLEATYHQVRKLFVGQEVKISFEIEERQ